MTCTSPGRAVAFLTSVAAHPKLIILSSGACMRGTCSPCRCAARACHHQIQIDRGNNISCLVSRTNITKSHLTSRRLPHDYVTALAVIRHAVRIAVLPALPPGRLRRNFRQLQPIPGPAAVLHPAQVHARNPSPCAGRGTMPLLTCQDGCMRPPTADHPGINKPQRRAGKRLSHKTAQVVEPAPTR